MALYDDLQALRGSEAVAPFSGADSPMPLGGMGVSPISAMGSMATTEEQVHQLLAAATYDELMTAYDQAKADGAADEENSIGVEMHRRLTRGEGPGSPESQSIQIPGGEGVLSIPPES